jgi:hypothetical protein
MEWKIFAPYIVPLLIAAIILRRVMRVQKARTIRLQRLWIFPALLLAVTAMSLGRESSAGLVVYAAFLAAGSIGGAIGWYRVHTLEFSVDAESGKVSARATRLGALLVFGLIALRYLADLALKKLGFTAGNDLVHATDAMLVFSTSMFVARSVHTWIRARAALEEQKRAAIVHAAQTPGDVGGMGRGGAP